MKYNEFKCPNCGAIMTTKIASGRYECFKCGKKYKTRLNFWKMLIFILIFINIPIKLINGVLDRLNFIQYKFLVSILIVLLYGVILIFSGLYKLIVEKFGIFIFVECDDE